MKNILITGAKGQLGSEIESLYLNKYKDISELANFSFTDIDSLDLSNSEDVKQYINETTFDYIINCAAYTNVDKAESDKDQAFLINSKSVKNIVESMNDNTKFVHISTDYVFDGNAHIPYTEEMPTSPTSVYGESKREGELYCLKSNNSMVIRTSWLYSSFGNNFAKTMLKLGKEREELKVVFDQVGTPTYAKDLARAIIEIISQSIINSHFVPGVYHYSNEGICSWYDFAKTIIDQSKSKCMVTPIESKDYPTPVKRPFYSVLNKHKIKNTFNITIPHWTEGLKEFFTDINF
jgi:dTDP-4-dehydrorhamnose reductase